MSAMNFIQSIGYFENGVDFLKSINSILEKYLKVLPDSQEVIELTQKNARQEELKKVIPGKTNLLEKAVDNIFKKASAKVNIAKGVLVEAGYEDISKSIPKISTADSLEKRVGWLSTFRSFLEQYKSTLSIYPQLDSAKLSASIDEIMTKKKERDSLKQEQMSLTDDLEKGIPKATHNLAMWLKVAELFLEMEGRKDLIKQIPRQPIKKKKKESSNS
jgi:hypothetical protein